VAEKKIPYFFVDLKASFLDQLFFFNLQVIFPALDIRVKNVAQTYSLEHKGESALFDQLFNLLCSNVQHDHSFRRELASCTGAIQTSLIQHMSKEEEQVHVSLSLVVTLFCQFVNIIKYTIILGKGRNKCSFIRMHLKEIIHWTNPNGLWDC